MIGDELIRVWNDLVGRLGGPMSFRFLMQPTMGAIFAIRDGIRDAKVGNPAFGWSLKTDPSGRGARIREGWKAVSKIFCLAVALDLVYEIIVLRKIYPGEALIVAFVVAIVPYFLLRGPANRVARFFSRRKNDRDSERRAA